MFAIGPSAYSDFKLKKAKERFFPDGIIEEDNTEPDEKLCARADISRKLNAMHNLFIDLDESDIELMQNELDSDNCEDDFDFIPSDSVLPIFDTNGDDFCFPADVEKESIVVDQHEPNVNENEFPMPISVKSRGHFPHAM